MCGAWKKQPSILKFTIHHLKLPSASDDGFQVEWVRGESKGITDISYSNELFEVVYERNFHCKATMYINKSNNSIRPKFVTFSVIILKDGVKKVFGKVSIDVSLYYHMSLPQLSTFELDSPHSQISELVISFTLNPSGYAINRSDFGETHSEFNLSSISETIPIDNEECEWDLSSGSSQPAVQSFLERRSSKTEVLNNELSQFMRKAEDRPPSPPQTPPPTFSFRNKFNMSTFLHGRDSLSNLTLAQSAASESLDMSTKGLTNFLFSVVQRTWDKTPIAPDSFPKPTSAFFSALLFSNIFDRNQVDNVKFTTIIDAFFDKYHISTLVDGGTPYDKFIVSLYLLKCLHDWRGLDKLRSDYAQQSLIQILHRQLKKLVQCHIQLFVPLVHLVISGELTGTAACDKVVDLFDTINEALNAIPCITQFIDQMIMNEFDILLVNELLRSPNHCMFGNAIQINNFITILGDQYSFGISSLRQAAGVLMMAKNLCNEPELMKSLCPSLHPSIAAKLMLMEQPDEFNNFRNEVDHFVEYYNVDLDNIVELDGKYRGDFCEVIDQLAVNWQQNTFSAVVRSAFPYLNAFFT